MSEDVGTMVTEKSSPNGSGTVTVNAEHLAVFTETLLRKRVAGLHGLQYGEERDLYAVGGYKRRLQFEDYWAAYERDGVAGQIVDMPAETTWRRPPVLEEEGHEDGTDFTAAWEELVKRVGVWGEFERADTLARIGRYSVVLIGTGGTDDLALTRPLRNLSGPQDVLYLQSYSERFAKIEKFVEDSRDPRYGLPEVYKIDLRGGVENFRGAGAGTQLVHWTHTIHVAEKTLNDRVFGRPALQRVFNDLQDLQKIRTSSGEAFWQRVAGILGLKIDKDVTLPDEVLAELPDQLAELFHELRKTFFMQGGELYRVGDSEPDPSEAANLSMTVIAAGAGIPKRMLFGSETGERASTEDQKTFLGSVSERQVSHAEPNILRPFVDRLVEKRGLPRPSTGPGAYIVNWPELFEVPEKDQAEANRARAQAAKDLTPMGGDPTLLVEIDDERNVWLRPLGADDPSPFEGAEEPLLPEPPEAVPDEPTDGGT